MHYLYKFSLKNCSNLSKGMAFTLSCEVDFPHLVANTWGGALFGDLGPTGITKRHAIEVLLDYLHADPKDTISFDDVNEDGLYNAFKYLKLI